MVTGRIDWVLVIRGIAPNIALYVLAGVAAGFLHVLADVPQSWGLPEATASWLRLYMVYNGEGVPFTIISALGAALAIFLGFRNNSAYDRWWEARKIWGALVNDSRSWARQVSAWVNLNDSPAGTDEARIHEVRRELILRQAALVWGLGMHLRRQQGLIERIAGMLPDGEAESYRGSPNVITALLVTQGRRVAELRHEGLIEHFRHLELDRMLTRLSDIQGKCERIKNTPVPRQYDEIPRVFVVVYGLLLPFGLVPAMGFLAVPVAALVAILFVLLERSGRMIEIPSRTAAWTRP